MNVDVKIALASQCVLGEGLHWDSERNLLWFVDVLGPRLFWFDPDTQQSGSRSMPESIGWVLTVERSNRVMVGLQSGIALIDPFDSSATLEWIDRRFPGHADQRLNDAKADRAGRLWYGSVSATDESKSVGCLARCEISAGHPVIVDSGYQVTNGPAFSQDGKTMLHSDSRRRVTYKFDVDVQSGSIGNRKVWKEFAADEGAPDGMTFDANDCIWIAHWGAAQVCRYDRSGDRLQAIRVPATDVTNVCIGGRNLNRLFVTSASRDLNAEQKKAEPHAGDLFEIMGLRVAGLPSCRLRAA